MFLFIDGPDIDLHAQLMCFFHNIRKLNVVEGRVDRINMMGMCIFRHVNRTVCIQKGSPVDSYVTPEAWDMPGYESKVIMAAGAFTMGASIELSADAPIREPFAVWLQGGITYPSGKAGILLAAQEMLSAGNITL